MTEVKHPATENDREEAASLVEYALLVALVAVICIAAITAFGKQASQKFSTVTSALAGGG